MKKILVAIIAFAFVLAAANVQRFETQQAGGTRWFRGNTHTHTTESDGDSPPELVARWYKEHQYQFLVLSDHNVFTDPRRLASLVDSTFLLIAGEEVSASFQQKPVHVNGLNIPGLIEARSDSTLVGTIQKNVDAIREVRGVPHINHPNFRWAFGAAELLRIRNDRLLEIHNGHPLVHNEGGGGAPSMEAIWDELLTAGKRVYGIAVDDAHHFMGEFSADRANPGRGWVAVRANQLDAAEIMMALEEGRFYASTGVELEDIVTSPSRIQIRIKPRGDFRYTTTFIGDNGVALGQEYGLTPSFDLAASPGRLTYVRARVTDSGGFHAWVQPVFTQGFRPADTQR
jgi:hypothetical protein